MMPLAASGAAGRAGRQILSWSIRLSP